MRCLSARLGKALSLCSLSKIIFILENFIVFEILAETFEIFISNDWPNYIP
jgi:hypothetical protein